MSSYDKYAVKQEFRHRNEAVINWIDFYEKVVPESTRSVISIDQFVKNVPYLIRCFSRQGGSLSPYADFIEFRYVSKNTYKACANAAGLSITSAKNKITEAEDYFKAWLSENLFENNKLLVAIVGTLTIDKKMDVSVQHILDKIDVGSGIDMGDYVKLFFSHPNTFFQFLKLKK